MQSLAVTLAYINPELASAGPEMKYLTFYEVLLKARLGGRRNKVS